MLKIKRAYEKMETSDGKRIYIDRLWPRGLSKEEFVVDEWLKELSPTYELRKWFGHDPVKFPEFRKRYVQELSTPEQKALLKHVAGMAKETNVTLIYSAKDTEHNNAVVLAKLIERLMKEKVITEPTHKN
jgi:uncharacterized protein YeaO (DUF488 family)